MHRSVTSSLTYRHAVGGPPADDTASPAGNGAGDASQVAACLWDFLPADMLAGIGSYLSLSDRIRLSEADRRTRSALLPQLDSARLEWMLSRVSNLSTLDAALAEIARRPLRPTNRAELLGRLFDSIELIPCDMRDIACSKLLDAVAGLPVPSRGQLLRRIVETVAPRPPGWSNRPPGRDSDMVNRRLRHEAALWAMVDQQPATERIVLLILAVASMDRADFASVDFDDWIERALALPEGHRPMAEDPGQSITCRGKLLQVLLRGAEESGALRDEAAFRRFMAVSGRLHTADGRPAMQERVVLLTDLASALARCHRLERHDSERVWDALLETACTLPPDAATGVMLTLSDWFAVPHHAGDVVRARRLWETARQTHGGDITGRAQWLVALGNYMPDRTQFWHTLWNEWRACARPDRYKAAILFGRAAAELPPLPDGTPAWPAVLREAMALPMEHRGAVMVRLAGGLRDSETEPDDVRWKALVDAAAALPAAAQLPVLSECIDHDVVLLRRYWSRYLGQLTELPPAALSETLPFALYLTREFDHDEAERAWWDVATELYRMPAQGQGRPWRYLFRVIYSLYHDDEEQLEEVQDFLEAPLRAQTPIVQRNLLIHAITDLEAREYEAHFRWMLGRADSLPSALRAPVLARLTLQALVMESADGLVPIWDALVRATERLPPGYRGAPLHGLERLYGTLPAGHQKAALPTLLALCAGVPAIDLPQPLARLPQAVWQSAMYQR